MKLNKLSLSLAITLALGSTFGMAHAETTAAHAKAEVSNVATKTDTAVKTDVKRVDASVKNDAKRVDASVKNDAKRVDTSVKNDAKRVDTSVKNDAKHATTVVKHDTKHADASVKSDVKHVDTVAKNDAKRVDTSVKSDAKRVDTSVKNDAKRVDTSVKNDVKEDAAKVEGKKAVKAKENLPAGVYPDTKDNWARDAIQAMTQAGYLSGYADNTFKPSAQITREQAAAIYGKVLQHNLNEQELADIVTKESSTSYSDVEADRWSSSAIKLVSAAGVMEGTSKTAFTPSKTMDREQFVASAASLAKKLNLSTPVKTEKVTFKDEASISSTYLADIQYMAQRGIVASGATENFNPKQPVTRAQAATILNRMLNGAGLATPKHTATEAKAETAVKEDVKKADTAAEKDASKVSKDAKKDVAKADKAAKADAKKVEKDVKGNKNAAVAQKTEPTRTVRPVRRSTLKALDQKQQAALEDKVFNELNKTYKTEDAFQDYGVMYWRDNQLHVALKTDSDISTVKANLAARGDSTVNNYVVVEPSQYSQTEYDAIDANFRNYYNKNEKAGTILATFPDVENNQLYAVVTTASKETQQGMSKLFGSKVKMTVKR
ncbi:S-layer homology domain-containing protein [Veillonella sp.]|uniref:S-layer homology domain-containing protein n=1 Tax=Veillonella sp. TaxID=1926307 RepID=UPI0029154469|nr:S-layer homology domain-containing protein [Veillonella sp.]MDU5966345.1 S-layer homology domain-containing protein [Veillonella sp.]